MTRFRITGYTLASTCLLLSCISACPAFAQSDRAVVREYAQRQQRAKTLTERLMSRLIDLHLQRMRDNGLTDLPLYEELSSMRDRVDELAGRHMPRVQDMLAAAAQAEDAERKQLLTDAQKEMQAILRRLIVERELVRARRQRAELIQRIREIIVSQQHAHQRTTELAGTDEQAILAALDQQGTTKLLFEQFLLTIASVSAWSGELGATAAEARRVLLASGIADKLDVVVEQLEQTEFRDAATGQQGILADLARIEIEIHKLLDPAWIGNDIARAVKEMIAEQETLRKQSRGFSGADPFALLEQQTLLQEKLSRLVEKLAVVNERATMLASRAEQSAEAARTAIFRDEMPAAVDAQGDVIGALVELQNEIIHNDGRISRALSAMEYRHLAGHLAEARKVLVAAREQQPGASENAAKARDSLKKTGERIGSLKFDRDTPRVIVRRVETAQTFLVNVASGKIAVNSESVQLASQLVRFAIGETTQGIADAGRNSDAMKLAELNRAAESVSRAVGAVRDDRLRVLAGESTENLEDRNQMLDHVKAIAEKVAQGVRELAAPAVPALEEASQLTAQVQSQLEGPKPEDLPRLAEPLEELATELQSASVELRTEMVWTAGALEERVVAELEKLDATTTELDRLADATSLPTQEVLRELGNRTLEQYAAVGAALHTAADVLDGRFADTNDDADTAVMTQRQLERACVLADIRRQELEELLEMIRNLVEAVERQQQAAEQLLDARDAFEASQLQDPPQDRDPQDSDAQDDPVDPSELAEAFEDFMNSLVDIGETASDLTNQQEVANKPIAEAAQIASQLAPTPASQEGGDPLEGDMEPMDGEMQPMPGEMEPNGGDLVPQDALGSAELLSGLHATALAVQMLELAAQFPCKASGPGKV